MRPDETQSLMYRLAMIPINEDGSFGERVKLEKLKTITEDNLDDLDPTEKNILLYLNNIRYLQNTAWTGEFNVKFTHKKISKKTFKKWCMSKGISRNDSDRLCRRLGAYDGLMSYQTIYYSSIFAPSFHTVFTNILIEGAKKSWMKK